MMTLAIWLSGLAIVLAVLFAVYWYAGQDDIHHKH